MQMLTVEIEKKEVFTVFPNPFEEELSIRCSDPAIGKELIIKIYDSHGDLITSSTLTRRKTIKVGKELNPGTYSIQLTDDEFQQTIKVVKN
jgi:hypothetical protein